MDETGGIVSAQSDAALRLACRRAATRALTPQVFCRIRRCRRNGKCLGRFAPMILQDGGPAFALPLCVTSMPGDVLRRFCSGVGAAIRDDAGTPQDTFSRHAPDDRPWPWPPIRLVCDPQPTSAPKRRIVWPAGRRREPTP